MHFNLITAGRFTYSKALRPRKSRLVRITAVIRVGRLFVSEMLAGRTTDTAVLNSLRASVDLSFHGK